MDINEILDIPPYSLSKGDKHKMLDDRMMDLSRHHYANCQEYRKMLDATGVDLNKVEHYEDLPFLPVSLFKDLDLLSVPKGDVVKTMTSSGTTGQKVSKIYLDRDTAANQRKVLSKIVASFIGNKRVPMIIIDSSNVVKDRNMFSARGAGILGFSIFGFKSIYALDDEMNLNIEALKSFIDEHAGETIFMFGFTFMIWQHFYRLLKESGYHPDLSKAVLVHGGGWKKLVSESVSSDMFKESLHSVCGIEKENIHDYYGMVEQTGSIYVECECGHLHVPAFSDVIIRRPDDFSMANVGEKGIIEVVSVLPQSYPGHILLTEDEGELLGEDDCPCGRKGKYFKIEGRLKNAEIRGCSDTYASKFGNLSGLKYVIGDDAVLDGMSDIPAMQPFSEEVISFFNDLSKSLMKEGRGYSDVATFGFWCRKSALLSEKAKYDDCGRRLGRGIVFHSTPSNVPVNFAFSFAAGLLAGNANIVRLPAKDFPQVEIICKCINELLSDNHKDMAPYICMVKYPPSLEITNKFSSMCNSRVIWGGDATIAEIRQSPLSSRANEITFADRYSIAVIDGDKYLAAENEEKITQDFYNDTYFSDQNACTAPRIIIWIGKEKSKAKETFWNNVYELASKNYNIAPVQCVGKLSALYKAASCLSLSNVTSRPPFIMRLSVHSIEDSIMQYRYNSGFFFEYDAERLSDIAPLSGIKCQTLTYYGLSQESIDEFIRSVRPRGVDRIVPMGKSMDFTLVWDGYDLIRTLSRVVNVI